MRIKWNEYTWYSKLAAAVFFIVIFPGWMFYLGQQYNEYLSLSKTLDNELAPKDVVAYAFVRLGDLKVPQIKTFSSPEIQNIVNTDIRKYYDENSCVDIYSIEELRDQLKIRQTYADNKLTDAELQKLTKDDLIERLDFYYATDSEVTFASKDILSVHVSSSSYCGGAHPNNEDISITYDLKTGERVELIDLFKSFGSDKDALSKIIKVQDTDPRASKNDVEECAAILPMYLTGDNLQYASFHLSDEGLIIVPSLPHAAYVCTRGYVVPISEILTFIDPEGILPRLQS